MNKNEYDKIWESYVNEGGMLDYHRQRLAKQGLAAGEAGKPHGDATPVLEGVKCSCQDCSHWVVGDLCGASEISLSKTQNQQGMPAVICETYNPGSER